MTIPGNDVRAELVFGTCASSVSGTANFTSPNFGTPKACLVFASGDNLDNTVLNDHSRGSIGFSDFTGQFCIVHQDEDGQAKVDCDSMKSNTTCYHMMNEAAAMYVQGTASAITDGVMLTNTGAAAASIQIAIVMLAGEDIGIDLQSVVVASSNGANTVITLDANEIKNGTDKLVFLIGVDLTGEDSAGSGINNSFGVCHITGNQQDGFTHTQRCIGWSSDHQNTTAAGYMTLETDHALKMITETGGSDWAVEVATMAVAATTTVRLITRDANAGSNMECYVLVVDLGLLKGKVGSVDLPISGATWTPSVSLGWVPQYVGMAVTRLESEDAIISTDNAGSHGISNVTVNEETFHGWYNDIGLGTTDTKCGFRSRAMWFFSDDAVLKFDMNFSTFNNGDWTYTINSEDETVAKKALYWAIETNAKASETFTNLSDGRLGEQNSFSGPFELA